LSMDQLREKIIVQASDAATRASLQELLSGASYEVADFAASAEVLEALRTGGADLFVVDAGGNCAPNEILAAIRGAAATEATRVIFLVGATAADRACALDLGADDAISLPYDDSEVLSRVRAQLRTLRTEKNLRDLSRIAEEGQQIAHTAFEALAVTEKMASDASSLGRNLKIGVSAAFGAVVIMVGVYFLFVRSAQHETKRMNTIIAQLGGEFLTQQDLAAKVRELRQQQSASQEAAAGKDELRKHADDLKAKMASADANQVAVLQKELAETNARLKHIEQAGDSAEATIAASVQSVCLLHVSVAFREKESGRRLRYAGLNPQGEPIRDSDGKPVLTLDGRGPEVKADIFGTGFLAGSDGRVVTNHHVAEPWWKGDELSDITLQGFQPEISTIRAYFPGDSRAFHAEIQDISKDTDLATMRVDLQGMKRPLLTLDAAKNAAVPGEAIVLMGYATGLAAILARADDATVQKITDSNEGDVSEILDELARRNLIRPIITQGHIGDILPDKILFDAQTTSGGSGGPLFNQQGKVIGVTYAVLRGFGGSNFGIPIRYSQPLLAH
jgi:S1-C subfamily serine protease/DNA-binding NarL/FixJ family response regulator